MRTLDRSRPYAETSGNGMRFYEQDGLLFDLAGLLLDGPEAAETPQPEIPDEPTDLPTKTALNNMSAADLRTLVELHGGEYTTRLAAIAFLSGASE